MDHTIVDYKDYKKAKIEFGLRLARLRENLNISARDMSLQLGQNPGYINSIETGKSLPSMENFFHICEFVGITESEFFDMGNDNPEEFRHMTAQFKRLSAYQQKLVHALIGEMKK